MYRVGDRTINEYGAIGGMKIERGNKYSEKTYPIAALSSTNAT
jgi:hypothetical protein